MLVVNSMGLWWPVCNFARPTLHCIAVIPVLDGGKSTRYHIAGKVPSTVLVCWQQRPGLDLTLVIWGLAAVPAKNLWGAPTPRFMHTCLCWQGLCCTSRAWGGLGQAFRDRCFVKQINTNQSISTTNSAWAYLPEFLLNYSFLFKGYKQCAFNQQTDWF